MQEELENMLSEQISDDLFSAAYAVDGDVDIENPALASAAAAELSKHYSAEQIAKMHHDQNVKALKRLQAPQQFGGDFKPAAPLGIQGKDLDVDFAVGTPPPTFPGGHAAPKSLELHWAKERRKLFSKISRAKKFAAKYGYEFNMPKKWNISYAANRRLPQGEVESAGTWELDLTATDPTKGIKFVPHYKAGTIPKKTRIDVYGGDDEAAWEKVRDPNRPPDWAKYWGEKIGIDPRTLATLQWGVLGAPDRERPAVVPRTYRDPRTGEFQKVDVVDVSQAPEYQPWGVTPKQLSQTGESGIKPEQVSMTYGDIIASDPGRVEAIKRAYDKRQKFKEAGRYMSPEETGLIPDVGMPMEWPYKFGITDIFHTLGMPDMEEKMNNQAAQQLYKKDYDELDWLQKKELLESEELRNVQTRWFGDPFEGSMGGFAGSYEPEAGLESPGADYQMGALDLFDIAMVPLWGSAAARAGAGGYRAFRAAPRATKIQFIRAINHMARNYMHWRYRGGKLPGQELHPHFQTFRSSVFPKGRPMLPPKGGTARARSPLDPLPTTPSGVVDPKQLRAPPPGPDPSLPHKGTTYIRESYEKSKFNKIVQEEYKKLIKKELEGHKKLLNIKDI